MERQSPRHTPQPSPRQSPKSKHLDAHVPASPRGFKAISPRSQGHSGGGIISSPRNRSNGLPTMGGLDGLDSGLMSPRMSKSRDSSNTMVSVDHGDDECLMFGIKHMQLKKDAHKYKEPHLLISVVDKKGNLIEAVQRTPDANVEQQTLIFDYVVSLETTRSSLVEKGGAIFFELRHWKCSQLTVGRFDLLEVAHEEGRHSVKAYAYINASEIKHMACRLPIFKSSKPTDFRRLWQPQPLSGTHELFMHMDMIVGPRYNLETQWGYVFPRPPSNSGAIITFFIDSIGLKDADSHDLGQGSGYVNPRMMLTVIDGRGNKIDKSYETKEDGVTKERQAIIFDQELSVPLHVEDLVDLDAYIYFEFVHFKAHKAKDSVKCYSYMSVQNMRNGRIKLPIYKCEKPTDMSRGFTAAPNSIKDLWFKMEIFCEAFNDLPPVEYGKGSRNRAESNASATDDNHRTVQKVGTPKAQDYDNVARTRAHSDAQHDGHKGSYNEDDYSHAQQDQHCDDHNDNQVKYEQAEHDGHGNALYNPSAGDYADHDGLVTYAEPADTHHV